VLGERGLVGGDVKGDVRLPVLGVKRGDVGSHGRGATKEDDFDMSSEGEVVGTEKHDVHFMGASCVHSIVIGPCTSQKWARDIWHNLLVIGGGEGF